MTDRAYMPDYLRLFALFGIVVVNVQFIAFSFMDGAWWATFFTTIDGVALWLVDGIASFKTFGLFSFMFGVGLAYLMRSAERRALPFAKVYRRRMIGLVVLGFFHGCLFYPGDILVAYGLTGGILFLMRHWSVRGLARLGGALIALQAVVMVAMLLFPDDGSVIALEQEVMTEGSYLEVIQLRSMLFAVTFIPLAFVQGFAVLGWFCLGLAAVKSGMIGQADHPLWAKARRSCLGPGVGFSLVGVALWFTEAEALGTTIWALSAPVATLGYLGLIAAIARPPGRFMARVLTAGGSSLTIYLGQLIVLSTIFAPYGLGLWHGVGPATATLIAVIVTSLLIGAVTWWRRHFALGPFEWVLRAFTYRGMSI